MNLTKIIRKIQYQTAKLEVIEILFWYGKNDQPSLETEMAYNVISTLRQNLFNTSEACFESSLDTVKSHVASLQNTLIGANNLLAQMSSGLTSTEMQVVFLKNLLDNIFSELVDLQAELSNTNLQPFQTSNDAFLTVSQFVDSSYPKPVSNSSNFNSAGSAAEQKFKDLINKCMGDFEKAERLIQYECQKNSELDRAGAIRSAIRRWESDNR